MIVQLKMGRAFAFASAFRAALAVLGLAVAAAGCRRGDAEPDTASAAAPVTVGPENLAVVDSAELTTGPVISGSLTPEEAATLRAQVPGQLTATYADQGQRVTKGEVLARIEATALQDAYLSARQQVRTAESALQVATRNAERSQTLSKAGAIADRDLEAAQQAQLNAQGALADARARLANAQKQLGDATVRAPFTGIVADAPLAAGDVVQVGTVLFSVVNPATMRLEGAVPAEQLSQLAVGTPVEFTVNGYPGRTFEGKVSSINPAADPVTRQVRLLVSIPNKDRNLVAGLFAQGQVTTDARQALLVPAAAVDQRGVTPTVLRLHQGKVQQAAVSVGARDERRGLVEIRSGLAPGDTVLLGAAQAITPGTPVRVLQPQERSAAADSAAAPAAAPAPR